VVDDKCPVTTAAESTTCLAFVRQPAVVAFPHAAPLGL
jgi:hypothetical protein